LLLSDEQWPTSKSSRASCYYTYRYGYGND
jgi:hypothetical protein